MGILRLEQYYYLDYITIGAVLLLRLYYDWGYRVTMKACARDENFETENTN